MISEAELCRMIKLLDGEMLREWVEIGLVRSAATEPLRFDDADVARVRLICELRFELDVEEASLPLVLSLMDQLYDLRRSSRAVAAAIAEQPRDIQARIAAIARQRLIPGP